MKTCEKCKKVFNDDMSYCPYCGEKHHDYQKEMKDAMSDLFEVKKDEDVQTLQPSDQPASKDQEQENKSLNRILMGLIAALTVVFLVGGYWLTNRYFFPEQKPVIDLPPNEPVVDDETPAPLPNQTDEEDDIQQPPAEPNNPVEVMDEQFQGNYVTISSMLVSKQEESIRLEITCDALKEGQILLSDGANLTIGPIDLHQGSNTFYYMLNIHENSQYTLSFDVGDGIDEMTISYEMLQGLLQE